VRRLLGTLFSFAASARVAAYERGLLRRATLDCPVVSVGNLGLGGSGKTPVVRKVAELVRGAGARVAVLSRGYGGRFRGDVLVVSDGRTLSASAEEAGDEPVMLARALPGVVVAVGARRDVVGRAVEARFGPLVHVLDDGFQHLRLARDLDLVCLDVGDLDDRPLPAGRLRERPEALARASLVLLTRIEAASEAELQRIEARLGAERTLRVRRRVAGFHALDGTPTPPPARAFLVAAIARPERLEADAAAQGCAVVGRRFFRDHHRLSPRELDEAAALARAAGATALLTTAKDAVRLPQGSGGGPGVIVLEIEAEIERGEARLRGRLEALVRRVA
jgi:tetraacyldisaccharide 4'-kinase